MKRSILVLLVTATLAGAASAQIGFRNISSVSVDYYFDGAIANDVNQVFLLTFLDWLAAEFKIQREDTATIHETRGAVAPIFIVPPYYFIVRYGIGYGSEADPDSDPQISHEATIDANLETASYLANITFRASFYPGGILLLHSECRGEVHHPNRPWSNGPLLLQLQLLRCFEPRGPLRTRLPRI